VPIYLKDERWPRLAQLYEVLLNALDPDDVDRALDLPAKLREHRRDAPRRPRGGLPVGPARVPPRPEDA
jgi:hypothetical protein